MSTAPVLHYAPPRLRRRPRRVWLLLLFLSAVVAGETVVPRMTRWPWPLPEDCFFASVLVAGAALMALGTSMPGWAIGLYGLVGACAFIPGQAATRAFRIGIADPGAVHQHLAGWVVGVLTAWLICRCSVLLRRLLSARNPPAEVSAAG